MHIAQGIDALGIAQVGGPWRVHYHVPLHAAPAPPLTATVPVLRAALRALLDGPEPACDHFDVEIVCAVVALNLGLMISAIG